MEKRPRSLWFYLGLLLLAASAIGIRNGLNEWSGAGTPGQRLATITELAYGILGPLAALALLGGWSGQRILVWGWALCVTATGGMAAVVWGGAPLWAGLAAGVATGLIAALVIWMSGHRRKGLRP